MLATSESSSQPVNKQAKSDLYFFFLLLLVLVLLFACLDFLFSSLILSVILCLLFFNGERGEGGGD